MIKSYAMARDAFGMALGGRAWEKDPARKLLWAQVAELMCLLGDDQGCLDTSTKARRPLGPYEPNLSQPAQALGPSHANARAFVTELQQLSEHWGWDASVAAEAQAWLAVLRADGMRAKLQAARRKTLARLLKAAGQGTRQERFRKALESVDLAWGVLDQRATVQGATSLAAVVLDSDAKLSVRDKKRTADALDRGFKVARILGDAKSAKGIKRALDALETKALSQAELDFAMAPAAENFESDLAAARKELKAFAALCPLRSRPGVVLGFAAAYAGVIAYEPEAAAQLRPLRESLSVSDPYLGARVLAMLGRDALLAGNFHEAQIKLERAVLELGDHEDTRRLAALMQANRAQALSAMGQYALAARAFAQAARSLEKDWPAEALQARLGLAHSRIFAGQLDAAQKALQEAARLGEQVPQAGRSGLMRALALDRALLAVKRGELEQAARSYARVAEEARQASDIKAGAIALTNLAELDNDAGRFKQALARADDALKWLDRRSQADAAWQALCEKGRALAGLGKGKAAARALDESIALVEQLRSRIGAEGARRSFAQAKTRLYGAAVGLAVDRDELDRAFTLSERARGRAFLDMLAERRIRLGKAEWQSKLGPARAHMLRSLPLPRSFAPPAASLGSARRVRVEPIEARPAEGWRSLVSVNPARVKDVRAVLERDEALLSFFHDGQRLLVFLVSPKELRLAKHQVDAGRLASKVNSLMRAVADPGSRPRKVEKKARALYRICFGELALPAGVKRLVVVPWGPLHQVPFGALHDGERYLVDRFQVSNVPSGSSLVMLRARKDHDRRRQVLALANPATGLPALPAADREAAFLAQLFAKSSQIRRGAQATERAFKKEAPGKRFLHLASHGTFLQGRPMDSYLALAGPGGKVAELRATEVLGLDLSAARLVVLSACHSGELDVQAAEERLGLSRAFLHAGARALVTSLWELSDDSALALTRALYQGVKKGRSPAAALTVAQRQVKAQARFSHPFYWASLSLVGS